MLAGLKDLFFFISKTHPAQMGEIEIASFITDLAVIGKVAASTQNQALQCTCVFI